MRIVHLHLMELKFPIKSNKAESYDVKELLKKFDSAGMSLGALSPDAHETLAEAMNSMGARSNSGEGGEAKERYGTSKMSKIKQVASGRFGVTPDFPAGIYHYYATDTYPYFQRCVSGSL